jgi:acetylornithine aminotransferase
VAAVAQQAGQLAHTSNLYANPRQVELAEALLAATGAAPGGRVFLANSGTEANEAALKAALRTDRSRVLALEHSFHGRTLGSLALTATEAYRAPFQAFTGPVEFLPAGDAAALEAALAAGDVAALVLEPIQGEAGVLPLDRAYLAAARDLTRRYGALLVVDEVQTGTFRTGTFLACANPALVDAPLEPDFVTLAKGLGGGFPIGAAIAMNADAAALLAPGDHGTTFGGNPLAAAAALAVLDTIGHEHLGDHAAQLGAAWAAALARVPGVVGVRGAGLLLGVQLARPVAKAVAAAAQGAGFLINAPRPDCLRLAPPLILTPDQAASFTDSLPSLIASAVADAERTDPA